MLRWRIAILVSVAIAISYLDRQTLPVAISAITKEIPVSNEQFATLQSAFLLAYAGMYLGGGKLMDWLGTRLGFTLTMVFWSIACASHGLATTFGMLAVSRFLLGMGEGGGFPAATRAMAEWFPTRERSIAMGIMNGGTALGGIAAPPLIALILGYASWRWVFFATAGLGVLWTIWWRLDYFQPSGHPRLGESERAMLEARMPARVAENRLALIWFDLLGFRQTWGLVIAKFLSDSAWYFYLFWLPKYLYDARGFNIKSVGAFAWMPPAAAGVGWLRGGWFSGWLIQKQYSLNTARKVALGLSAAVMPCIFLVPHVQVGWTIALFCLAYCGQQSWSTLIMVLPADLFPQSMVGAVAGMVGFGGAIGGIVFGSLVGYLLDHCYGYPTVFAMAGSMHVMAFVVILATIRRVTPLIDTPEIVLEGAK